MGPTWWPHDQVSHRSDSSPPLEHTNILRTLSWRVLWCGGRYWRDEWPTDRKTEQITSCQEMSEYRTNDEHVPLPWRGQPADGLSMAHATGCLIIWWVNNIYHLPVSHLLLFCPARHWLAADSVRNLIPIWKYGDDIHYPRFNFRDFFECAASLKMSTERSTCNLQKKRSDWRTSLPPGRHGRLTEQWKPTPIAIITKKKTKMIHYFWRNRQTSKEWIHERFPNEQLERSVSELRIMTCKARHLAANIGTV